MIRMLRWGWSATRAAEAADGWDSASAAPTNTENS